MNTGTVLDAAETIGIGHGPGMAVAAGLYTKCEKPIIVLLGDGGLGAGGGDIETCADGTSRPYSSMRTTILSSPASSINS